MLILCCGRVIALCALTHLFHPTSPATNTHLAATNLHTPIAYRQLRLFPFQQPSDYHIYSQWARILIAQCLHA